MLLVLLLKLFDLENRRGLHVEHLKMKLHILSVDSQIFLLPGSLVQGLVPSVEH